MNKLWRSSPAYSLMTMRRRHYTLSSLSHLYNFAIRHRIVLLFIPPRLRQSARCIASVLNGPEVMAGQCKYLSTAMRSLVIVANLLAAVALCLRLASRKVLEAGIWWDDISMLPVMVKRNLSYNEKFHSLHCTRRWRYQCVHILLVRNAQRDNRLPQAECI